VSCGAIARTIALADAYDNVVAGLDEAIEAMESGNKVRAEAAMARVTAAMYEAGAVIASGPLLPPIPVH
jgi:hypothetical protein